MYTCNSILVCQMGGLCFVSSAVRSHVPFIIVSIQISTALTVEPFLVQFSNCSQKHLLWCEHSLCHPRSHIRKWYLLAARMQGNNHWAKTEQKVNMNKISLTQTVRGKQCSSIQSSAKLLRQLMKPGRLQNVRIANIFLYEKCPNLFITSESTFWNYYPSCILRDNFIWRDF